MKLSFISKFLFLVLTFYEHGPLPILKIESAYYGFSQMLFSGFLEFHMSMFHMSQEQK